MTNEKCLYMHTIDGKPAVLGWGGYICFAGKAVTHLASSLAQIKREQMECAARDKGSAAEGQFTYGYVRITPKAIREALSALQETPRG